MSIPYSIFLVSYFFFLPSQKSSLINDSCIYICRPMTSNWLSTYHIHFILSYHFLLRYSEVFLLFRIPIINRIWLKCCFWIRLTSNTKEMLWSRLFYEVAKKRVSPNGPTRSHHVCNKTHPTLKLIDSFKCQNIHFCLAKCFEHKFSDIPGNIAYLHITMRKTQLTIYIFSFSFLILK